MNPYQLFADAIVRQAVNDYREALRGKSPIYGQSPQYVKKECESFFRSSWFALLTNVDGELIIEKVRGEINGSKTYSTTGWLG